MAEAHAAVAFGFVVSHEGVRFNYDVELLRNISILVKRQWRKWLLSRRADFHAGIYPASPTSLVLVISVVAGLNYADIDASYGMIGTLQRYIFGYRTWSRALATITFGATAWFLSIQVIRRFIKLLFQYKGWMYERAGKASMKTKIWMLVAKFIARHDPLLTSFQGSLPRLPLPSLDGTISRHLETVRPLVSEEKFKTMQQEANDFKNGIGRKLQRYLMLKSWVTNNYVSDWWEEYVYLRGRGPIMISSNYYGMDTIQLTPTSIQAARAANVIYASFMFRRLLERRLLKPIMLGGVIPLCSAQYERMFNSSRLPGVDADIVAHWEDARHVAVYHNGCWYKMPIYVGDTILTPPAIEQSLQSILDSANEPAPGEKHLAALTAIERVPWAHARKKHFGQGINKASLHLIERAAFVLILDDEELYYDPNDSSKLDHWAHTMLHGKGYDRWFDKTFNIIVSKNAKVGLNAEHSWADAPVVGHLMEFQQYYDNLKLGADAPIMSHNFEYVLMNDHLVLGYAPDGHTVGQPNLAPPPVQRLKWDLTEEAIKEIEAAKDKAQSLIKDVEMALLVFQDYGKGFVKTCKVSPDAYLQMALQLTYYRDQKKFCLTYEASMTRLYREGRTETVRTVTMASADWAKAMEDPNKTNEERIALLRKACDRHQNNYRDCMVGKGVDRHLFCLYVVSRYLEVDAPYLKEILSEPWRLSTSQTPHQQTDLVDVNKHPEYVSTGGGFGPVADDGYGVSYIIGGDHTISFHISSKVSCPTTSSKRFRETLIQALTDMRTLFQPIDKKSLPPAEKPIINMPAAPAAPPPPEDPKPDTAATAPANEQQVNLGQQQQQQNKVETNLENGNVANVEKNVSTTENPTTNETPATNP